MRISFERTGGFAGMKLKATVDSNLLSPAEANRLQKLVHKSRFYDLPFELKARSQGTDRFHYTLTIESDQGTHTVEASEEAIPADMRPLLDWLIRFCRSR